MFLPNHIITDKSLTATLIDLNKFWVPGQSAMINVLSRQLLKAKDKFNKLLRELILTVLILPNDSGDKEISEIFNMMGIKDLMVFMMTDLDTWRLIKAAKMSDAES